MDHAPPRTPPLADFPPPERWDDWEELDAAAWPRRVVRRCSLVPTICGDCEAACGLLAYVDRDSGAIQRLEGNPEHPGSRGRLCARGPATLNRIHDPERILLPMRRVGPRGSGRFAATTWDEVLRELGARIRKAVVEGRGAELLSHGGRPGPYGFAARALRAFGGIDHGSPTDALGPLLPDPGRAKFTLRICSHGDASRCLGPHAGRAAEPGPRDGKLAVCGACLSDAASTADHWLAPRPGTEALLLLGFVHVLLRLDLVAWDFVRDWVDWQGYQRGKGRTVDFAAFQRGLRDDYAFATPAHVASTSGLDAGLVERVGREIGEAGRGFAAHLAQDEAGSAGATARNLQFLAMLVGAAGAPGGTGQGHGATLVPTSGARLQGARSDLLHPREYPLARHGLGLLLPHLLLSGRGRIDTCFSVDDPVGTYPDGAMWIEALADEGLVGNHVLLSPAWNATARWADFVLPMGHAGERHELVAHETPAADWLGFGQPVHRVLAERRGRQVTWTYECNPGQVWEEDEFWIALSWHVDPDGSLGIRRHFESPYRPGERVTVEEHYRWIFENSVPGLPEAARQLGLSPLEYMRRRGGFATPRPARPTHEQALPPGEYEIDLENGIVRQHGAVAGVYAGGKARLGFPTRSRKLELFSPAMAELGWPEYAAPAATANHVDEPHLDRGQGEMVLVPTSPLPAPKHARSPGGKWLGELSNGNPVWIHPDDADRLGLCTGDLLRVTTRTGHAVNAAWITEGVRPGVVACGQATGRWTVRGDFVSGSRWQLHEVDLRKVSPTAYLMRRTRPVGPFVSDDPDSRNVWWHSGGVFHELTFPVQPDPVTGTHCLYQKVTVTRAEPGDRYGDVFVDTAKSMLVFAEWLAKARPAGDGPPAATPAS
ncbi:MAG: formate dehydrogenase [Planctomycetes bacterium]|nr:formate dehydrogenase [Planctomycetota bacterium]